MPSFNNPQPTNAILDDIVDIRELLRLNVKWDPTSAADIPAGAKRLVEVTGGWQIQIYDGAGWASIGKLMHGSGSIDGYTVSTSAKAGCIPVYNANAQLVGSITGNAATATKLATARSIDIGGIATADAQSFNGTANITIPITRITVNNGNDDALNGEVSKLHGGTGRTDGAAADVIVDSIAGNVKASEYGQIGRSKIIDKTVHADTLIVSGTYRVDMSGACERGWARNLGGWAWLDVREAGGIIIQRAWNSSQVWHRRSTNSGASWEGWYPIGGIYSGNVTIFISKSGSDLNTGLCSDYPVLTVERAMLIAAQTMDCGTYRDIVLCFGAGEWGNVLFAAWPAKITIQPYDGVSPTEYSEDLPKFTVLGFADGVNAAVVGIVVDSLRCERNSFVRIGAGYKRIGNILCNHHGYVSIDSQNAETNIIEVFAQTTQTFAFLYANLYGVIWADYINIKVVDNLTFTGGFINSSYGGVVRIRKGNTKFDAGEYTVNSIKVNVYRAGVLDTVENPISYLPNSPTIFDAVPGTDYNIEDAIINGWPYGAAEDNKVVHLSGNEIIAGTKTFSAAQTRYINIATPLQIQKKGLVKGGSPASNNYTLIAAYEEAGWAEVNKIAQIGMTTRANGTNECLLYAFKPEAGSSASVSLGIFYPASGVPYATCPTPPSDDDSNKIATTNWVKSNAVVSPATAAPKALGTAAVGSSAKYAREDHVHPLPSKFQDNAITTIRAIEFGGAGSGEGGLIDFHWGGTTADYTSRIIESSSGILTVNGLAISDGYASAKLRSKGSRSTDGTWSITGCTIGAPLLILHKGGSGTGTGTSVQIYVSSGGTGGNRSYGKYMLGTSTNEADMHGNVFVTIPTATTVNISVTGCADDGDVLYAYQ